MATLFQGCKPIKTVKTWLLIYLKHFITNGAQKYRLS